MNILFVIPSLAVGGAQSFLLRLLSAFPKTHNIYLYDVHPKQIEKEILSNLSVDLKIYSSKYERLELFLEKYPRILTQLLNRLNQYFDIKLKIDKRYFNSILKKNEIQIINSHMYLADSFVFQNCNLNIPKVSSFHGCYNLLWDKKSGEEDFYNLKSKVQRILTNYSGVITAAERHNEVFEKYEIKNQCNIQKIYYGFPEQKVNPISLREKYDLPKNSFIFGMVARGDITKGWQEAIDAFEILQKENENIYLILSGGTEYLESLKEKYINNKGIIFTGNVNNPLTYISGFDVGLLPTYYPAESLPNTVIEYLYCSKPVIGTNWAEIPKMIEIENNRAGEIIGLKDGKAHISELHKAMNSYIKNPQKLEHHSQLAKKAFTKFDVLKCTTAYIDFLMKTINNAQ